MQSRAKFPFLSSVKLIETNISMDLEMGYHMENIDNMSLLLTIQSISTLSISTSTATFCGYLHWWRNMAISLSRFSQQQSESHSQLWEHYQQHFTGYRVIIQSLKKWTDPKWSRVTGHNHPRTLRAPAPLCCKRLGTTSSGCCCLAAQGPGWGG